MQTISVNYFELVKDSAGEFTQNMLGSEIMESIDETLVPTEDTFFIKKFTNINHYIWHVESVSVSQKTATAPTKFAVLLTKQISNFADEFLEQTISKGSIKSPSRILWKGTLVEVDYGFIQASGHADGRVKSNKCYSDTLQAGEMRKRRLAIVVKAFSNRVQVVPVTCKEPNSNDKSIFKLSSQTLQDLCFYGSSGKDSWALCNMVETVSIRRILPPASFYVDRGHRKSGRSTKYIQKLSANELNLMKSSLLHGVSINDYDLIKESLQQAEEKLNKLLPLEADVLLLQKKYDDLMDVNNRLRLVEEVALSWERHLNGESLAKQVEELSLIYVEMEGNSLTT